MHRLASRPLRATMSVVRSFEREVADASTRYALMIGPSSRSVVGFSLPIAIVVGEVVRVCCANVTPVFVIPGTSDRH